MTRWIILDCNYLISRWFFATCNRVNPKELEEIILMSMLEEFERLQDHFVSSSFIFCFDGDSCKRTEIFEDYKVLRRRGLTEGLTREKRKITKNLRDNCFPHLDNVFWQDGFEADDIIASITNSLPREDFKVIVSSDEDLYQLIRNNTIIYLIQKKAVMDLNGFIKEFNIHPKSWASVKAIAGCATDNVPGIQGVGIKRAVKYLNEELDETGKAWQRLQLDSSKKIINRNMKLVTLPLKGTPTYQPEENNMTAFDPAVACEAMGFEYYAPY